MADKRIEMEDGQASVRVHLHGPENVILSFMHEGAMEEPFRWGFPNPEDFRAFVKMVNEFDAELAKVKVAR